jgi:iron complex outermembrane receptor protein
VLLDGQPLTDPYVGGTYLSNLPIGDVERIEVTRGPFSSLYGGEAMGGVINIITKRPEKESLELKSSLSDYNTYHHILSYGNKIGRLSFSLNLEKTTSEGDRTDLVTKSTSPGTAATKVSGWEKIQTREGTTTYLIGDKGKNYWDQMHQSCKFIYSLNPGSEISLSYTGGRREYGYRDPQSYLVDANGKPVDSGKVELPDQGTMTITPRDFLSTWGISKPNIYGLDYNTLIGRIALKGKLNLNIRDSFYVDPQPGATYHGGPGKLTETIGKTSSIELQGELPLREHLMSIGLNYKGDEAKAKEFTLKDWKDESSTTETTSITEGKGRLVALYIQGEVEPIKNLILFPSIRYDTWKKYDASLDDKGTTTKYHDKKDSEISPKLGLLYKLGLEKGIYRIDSFRASWGKAFRPPTTYELYRTWTHRGKTYAGNPELKPETAQSWEVGLDQHFGKMAISATYFASKIDDLIYSKWITGTQSIKENAGCGEISGFEIEGKMKIAPWLDAFVNYTLQDTEITSNLADPKTCGKHFEYVPEKMYNLGLSFHRNAFDASCIWHHVSKIYANSDNSDIVSGVYGAYDPVNTVDLKVGYSLKENLKLSLAGDNLFDKEYYQYYKSPGRTITIEAGWRY